MHKDQVMAKEKKPHKNFTRKRLVLMIVELVLLILVIVAVWLYFTFSRMQGESDFSDSELGIATYTGTESTEFEIPETTTNIFSGEYTNIALFGLDNRKSDNYDSGNSDSIMVLSINNETKEVRIVSVYRDTYLLVTNTKYRKANAGYAYGGVSGAIKMLNRNLDLTGELGIRHYICVDWNALVEVIDALGGVEIEITSAERKWINYYVEETAKGANTTATYVTETGLVTLDGVQATSYARIRYTSGNDYKRASRQRIVLQAMLEKAREADFTTLVKACYSVVDDVQTNLTLTQILSLAKDLKSYELVSTTGFPFDLTTMTLQTTGDTVIPVDLYSNVVQLHEYLFDDLEYVPSQTMIDISNEIVNLTGKSVGSTITEDLSEINETVGANGTEDLP